MEYPYFSQMIPLAQALSLPHSLLLSLVCARAAVPEWRHTCCVFHAPWHGPLCWATLMSGWKKSMMHIFHHCRQCFSLTASTCIIVSPWASAVKADTRPAFSTLWTVASVIRQREGRAEPKLPQSSRPSGADLVQIPTANTKAKGHTCVPSQILANCATRSESDLPNW